MDKVSKPSWPTRMNFPWHGVSSALAISLPWHCYFFPHCLFLSQLVSLNIIQSRQEERNHLLYSEISEQNWALIYKYWQHVAIRTPKSSESGGSWALIWASNSVSCLDQVGGDLLMLNQSGFSFRSQLSLPKNRYNIWVKLQKETNLI